MAKEKMNEFISALKKNEAIDFTSGDDAEFLIKKSYLGKNDLCYCGSGRKVIACCVPEEQFNKLAKKATLKSKAANPDSAVS